MRTWSTVLIALATLALVACDKPSASAPAKGGAPSADKATEANTTKPGKGNVAADGAVAGTPADKAPVAAAATAQAAAPDDESKLMPLPDGTFSGRILGDRVTGEITLVILDGVVISAKADLIRKQRVELILNSRSAADSRRLSLGGRKDGSFMSMIGTFVDGERAAGTFNGTVTKKKVSGRWYVIRR